MSVMIKREALERVFGAENVMFVSSNHTEVNCSIADNVNHPKHYNSHPSGVECITITEHMGFNLGNALKYIWRADLKGQAIEDLQKAKWYIEREIAKRVKE